MVFIACYKKNYPIKEKKQALRGSLPNDRAIDVESSLSKDRNQ
ncbi:hypothetical protein DERF_003581 [Dermatophagoides farinae]|uniref:Uncharacterized protein n=1 Tax=Dermatophagoides farinae TaxID=6954 RepID=A0A922IF95_DERFA|nr:hypothetical protein DERF_003581 [Dermatophagoides farinae]